MMIAKEQITNQVNRKVIALKNDEVKFIKKHCEEFYVYQNLRTGEKFICRKEKIMETDEVGALLFAEKEKKAAFRKKKNAGTAPEKTNQISIF